MRLSAFIAVALLVSCATLQPWNHSVGQTFQKSSSPSVERQLEEIADKLDSIIQAAPPKVAAKVDTDRVSEDVRKWVIEARDDIREELEQKTEAYNRFRQESKIEWVLEGRMDFETQKLSQIEQRLTNTAEELEEVQQRSKLLTARLDKLAKQKVEQLQSMKDFMKFQAIERSQQEELERLQDLYDSIVKQVADMDLVQAYGTQPSSN